MIPSSLLTHKPLPSGRQAMEGVEYCVCGANELQQRSKAVSLRSLWAIIVLSEGTVSTEGSRTESRTYGGGCSIPLDGKLLSGALSSALSSGNSKRAMMTFMCGTVEVATATRVGSVGQTARAVGVNATQAPELGARFC